MSIEQTQQLILLILNTVLVALLTAVLLGVAWLRQHWLLCRLKQMRSHHRQLTHAKRKITQVEAAELRKTRKYRQQIAFQYHWIRMGLASLHVAVLFFGISLLALSLRSLAAFDSLIVAALFLFNLGVASLLIGVSCLLVDLAQGNAWDEPIGYTFSQVMQQLTRQWSVQKLRRTVQLGRKT